jgi:hypothetical protein
MRTWFVVALALSLLGDVFLMLPVDLFVFGLGAFLLGHVAYTVGLNLHTEGNWLLAIPIPIVAAFLAIRLVRGIRASGEDALVGPVLAYGREWERAGRGRRAPLHGVGRADRRDPVRPAPPVGGRRDHGHLPPRSGRPGPLPRDLVTS